MPSADAARWKNVVATTVIVSTLALSAGLAGCAHNADQAVAPAPSQMALADIQNEIDRISKKIIRISRNRPFSGEEAQASSPVIFYYPDPGGGSFANYLRSDIRPMASSSRRSASTFDQFRIRELAQRRLELSMELRRRIQSQSKG